MPWRIEKRDNRFCVIRETDEKVEKCHAVRDDAVKHMRALYANVDKELTGFFVKQDSNGVWNWLGIVSNNWVDKEIQWLSAKAHQRFVEMVDSGEYSEKIRGSWLVELPGDIGTMFKEIADRGKPDLWYWHLPAPIGYTDLVVYDDRGYLIGMGRQKEGELYTSIFEGIAKSGVVHGMSHGMPMSFISFNKGNDRIIDEYLSTEFTALPEEEAANIGTTFNVSMKEALMKIPEHKKEKMLNIFDEETVAKLDSLLSNLEVFAEDSNIPRKETNMSDTTTEASAEELETKEVETEEVETEEVETEEVEDEAEAAGNDADESEAEDEPDTGMAMDPADFEVPKNMKEFAQEMTQGMKQVFADFSAQQEQRFKELEKQLTDQRDEIAQLKEAEGKRVAEKAAETPVASMAGWLATELGSVIGKEGARLHGNDERTLYNKSKEGEDAAAETPNIPGVPPTIAAMMLRQQGRSQFSRVPLGNVDGQ